MTNSLTILNLCIFVSRDRNSMKIRLYLSTIVCYYYLNMSHNFTKFPRSSLHPSSNIIIYLTIFITSNSSTLCLFLNYSVPSTDTSIDPLLSRSVLLVDQVSGYHLLTNRTILDSSLSITTLPNYPNHISLYPCLYYLSKYTFISIRSIIMREKWINSRKREKY